MKTETKEVARNYTGYGWEGLHFDDNLNTTEIAKLLRTKIRKTEAFKGFKISVTSEYFSMGSAINVRVTSIPDGFVIKNPDYDQRDNRSSRRTDNANALIDILESMGNRYRRSDTDSQIDYFDTNFYLSVSYDYRID